MTLGSCLAHGCETILRSEREREGERDYPLSSYNESLGVFLCPVLCCVVLCCVVLCCVVLCCVVL